MTATSHNTAHRPAIAVTRHAIAAGHYLATTAGFDILQAGGNAVDAGVAAGIALGVVQSDLVNCAGVAPIMIYHADKREVVTIAGLGTWPKALDPELFMREHGGKIPVGVLRTVVPAAPDAWITALRRYGTMSFGEVAGAAARLASEGFPMYPLMAASLEKHAEAACVVAVLRRGLSAERPPAASRRHLPPERSRRVAAIHDRPGEGGGGDVAARPVSRRRTTPFIAATSPGRSSPL